nr:hypothetical protein [uncultured Flavobacterium sp.]
MIKVVQYIPYLYLLLAILFALDSVEKFNKGENYIMSVAFTAVGIFMFIFRLRHIKKIKEQQNKNK